MTIPQNLQAALLDPVVELYQLDLALLGGPVFSFHNDASGKNLVFQGTTYFPFPIEAKGFEISGQGQFPRPTLSFSHIGFVARQFSFTYDELIGAKVIRKRTFAKHLANGDEPNDSMEFPVEVYFVEQKISLNKRAATFQLCSALDIEGVSLPRRQVIANLCSWQYRGPDCGYTGPPKEDGEGNLISKATRDRGEYSHDEIYDIGDYIWFIKPCFKYVCIVGGTSGTYPSARSHWTPDRCSKKVGDEKTGCKGHFGKNASLPFGGFPAAGSVIR